MAYVASEVDPEGSAGQLFALWKRNFKGGDEPAEKLRWMYLGGPAGKTRVLLLKRDGQETVGCMAMGVRRFGLAGKPGRAALLGDLAVDKAHRTVLPAIMLLKLSRRVAAREDQLAYGFANEAALPVLKRVGFTALGKTERWARVLRHATYVERVLKTPLLARPAGLLIDGLKLAQALPALLPARGALEWLRTPDARFDALSQAAALRHGVIGERGEAFMRWRFFAKPGASCEIATLADRPGGALRAYAVVERGGASAHVRDFLALDAQHLAALLDRLAIALWARGAANVSLTYFGASAITATLARCGFSRRQELRMVVADAYGGASVPPAEDWYLTEADEDI